jgi:hypothetical protein
MMSLVLSPEEMPSKLNAEPEDSEVELTDMAGCLFL